MYDGKPRMSAWLVFSFTASLLLAANAYWKPAPGAVSPWNAVYGTKAANKYPGFRVIDVDLENTSNATIASLKANGTKVMCYFSAGTYEDFRADKGLFRKSEIGKPLHEWPGENWLDIRSANVRRVIKGLRCSRPRQRGWLHSKVWVQPDVPGSAEVQQVSERSSA